MKYFTATIATNSGQYEHYLWWGPSIQRDNICTHHEGQRCERIINVFQRPNTVGSGNSVRTSKISSMTEKRNIRPVRYDTLRIVSRAIMCEKAWYVEDKSNYHYALFCGEKCVCSLTGNVVWVHGTYRDCTSPIFENQGDNLRIIGGLGRNCLVHCPFEFRNCMDEHMYQSATPRLYQSMLKRRLATPPMYPLKLWMRHMLRSTGSVFILRAHSCDEAHHPIVGTVVSTALHRALRPHQHRLSPASPATHWPKTCNTTIVTINNSKH